MTIELLEQCRHYKEDISKPDSSTFQFHKFIYGNIQLGKYYLVYATEEHRFNQKRPTKLSFQRIPFKTIFPPIPYSLPRRMCYEGPVPEGCYLKEPKLLSFDDPHSLDPASILLHEFCVYQMLSEAPHPNIPKFLGCLVKDGHLKGIILPKYPRSLEEKLETDEHIPVEKYLQKIKNALRHLHKLGLVYMNLDPAHIMLTEDDEPVLVGFSYCQFKGDRCHIWGGGDWKCKIPFEFVENTSPQADILAFDILKTLLEEEEELNVSSRNLECSNRFLFLTSE